MHYPLEDLIDEVRAEAPNGKTFAIKRSAWLQSTDDSHGSRLRARVIDGTPQQYIARGGKYLTSGLPGRTFEILLGSEEEVDVIRLAEIKVGENAYSVMQRHVQAVRFSGELIVPEVASINVVGATVPGEMATGFVHVPSRAQAAHLFQEV